MNNIDSLYVDQYCMTMAQSFWRHDQNGETTFELFVRRLPQSRDYLLVAGLADVLSYLENFNFTDDDLAYLRSLGLYEDSFLDYLRDLKFTGEIKAIPEGTVISDSVPIIQVTAPRIQATLIEPAIITIVNQQTLIASKVARIVKASNGREVWDFSLRRLAGPHASIGVARAAYIAGAAGTATMEAGKQLGIPTTGTMAHHYVQSFTRTGEVAAFKQFLSDYPGNGIVLVDTYDTHQGIKNAIKAAVETGISLKAIRLDSGDLIADSKWAREELDNAGFPETKIIASNDLDEYSIEELSNADAPIDSFGVGTRLGAGISPQENSIPALGIVYKLTEQKTDGQNYPVMKFAEGKETNPGKHEVWRVVSPGKITDTISLVGEELEGIEVMREYMENGKILNPELNNLDLIRARASKEVAQLSTRSIETTRSGKLEKLMNEIKANA